MLLKKVIYCRVRRALDLQTPGAQRGLDCSFASPFEPSHSLSSQSPDPCTPRISAPASVVPGEQLCSLDETSDWQQGSGRSGYIGRRGLPPLSRKRSELLPPPTGRNMRARCDPTAAAAQTLLARLQLNDDR